MRANKNFRRGAPLPIGFFRSEKAIKPPKKTGNNDGETLF
jgi:hypothetical protein